MFTDSHVHFDIADGPTGYLAMLERAQAAGVGRMVAIGGKPAMNAVALEAAQRFPERVRASLGLDRDQVPALGHDDAARAAALRVLRETAETGRTHMGAIGEIGLDYHYDADTADGQKRLFTSQLSLARELDLPVVVHSREADDDTMAALTEFAGPRRHGTCGPGVLHCFTGSDTFARRLLDVGFDISFSGILTFRNAESLRTVARMIPKDRLLIETDTPYLAPVPLRGQRNEPAFVRHVAETLAHLRGCTVEDVAQLTSANATRLFGFSSPLGC
ncbi:MAG: TatD family hydrolase [Lentisphaerae bacterium]|nr:TatD family hydrolase [Lentisphaerota bacterium]